jgi:hypothetical protein
VPAFKAITCGVWNRRLTPAPTYTPAAGDVRAGVDVDVPRRSATTPCRWPRRRSRPPRPRPGSRPGRRPPPGPLDVPADRDRPLSCRPVAASTQNCRRRSGRSIPSPKRGTQAAGPDGRTPTAAWSVGVERPPDLAGGRVERSTGRNGPQPPGVVRGGEDRVPVGPRAWPGCRPGRGPRTPTARSGWRRRGSTGSGRGQTRYVATPPAAVATTRSPARVRMRGRRAGAGEARRQCIRAAAGRLGTGVCQELTGRFAPTGGRPWCGRRWRRWPWRRPPTGRSTACWPPGRPSGRPASCIGPDRHDGLYRLAYNGVAIGGLVALAVYCRRQPNRESVPAHRPGRGGAARGQLAAVGRRVGGGPRRGRQNQRAGTRLGVSGWRPRAADPGGPGAVAGRDRRRPPGRAVSGTPATRSTSPSGRSSGSTPGCVPPCWRST